MGCIEQSPGTDNMRDIKYIIREAIDNEGSKNAIRNVHTKYPGILTRKTKELLTSQKAMTQKEQRRLLELGMETRRHIG